MHLRCLIPVPLLLATSAIAAEKMVEKTVSVTSGQDHQIGIFGRVKSDCTNGKVTIQIAEAGLNGTLTPKAAKLKAGSIPDCPDLEAEAAVFFYRSNDGFIGNDQVVVVVSTDDGRVERHRFTISVR